MTIERMERQWLLRRCNVSTIAINRSHAVQRPFGNFGYFLIRKCLHTAKPENTLANVTHYTQHIFCYEKHLLMNQIGHNRKTIPN